MYFRGLTDDGDRKSDEKCDGSCDESNDSENPGATHECRACSFPAHIETPRNRVEHYCSGDCDGWRQFERA